MTVPTGLITKFADIDLEYRDSCGTKWKETNLRKSRLERSTGPGFGKLPELFSRGSQRIVAFQ
jgi:hypothetical protein